jgi:hypothetical protein
MTHAIDDNATRTTPTVVYDKFRRLPAWIAAAFHAGRRSLRKAEAAQSSRCIRESFAAEEFQDTGIDPSDATGIGSWQPDLPFFMQQGYGRK